MTHSSAKAVLRQISGGAAHSISPWQLTPEAVIGREPTCDVVLASNTHAGVSRRHAAIRCTSGDCWEICDLGSANGTYVNAARVQTQSLQTGDRIRFGHDGPEFVFELQINHNANQPLRGSSIPPLPESRLTLTQIFPILSTRQDLMTKGFLIPGIATALTVISMFITLESHSVGSFVWLLGTYLATATFYFVYQLCGKRKPWWLFVVVAVFTFLFIESPFFKAISIAFDSIAYIFSGLSARNGTLLNPPDGTSSVKVFLGFLFDAGFREELTKALPVFIALLIGRRLSGMRRERFGVWEPLDGILLGAASSIGFTLNETILQYVPQVAQQLGDAAGIELLVPRVLGDVFGHMAWSGYFGYFIGLSATTRPAKAWKLIGIGLLTAAIVHALWDTFAEASNLAQLLLGMISYAFLIAAILKARKESPTRSENFATRFL